MDVQSVVIVGAGQGGYQVAASLRQSGFKGRVMLIGNEPGLPYQRPPLSKGYLLGKVAVNGLRFRSEKYFADNAIELVHAHVDKIDRENRRVLLRSGGDVQYDHLVLAVGGRNRRLQVPGSDLNGVVGIRSLADADELAIRMATVRSVVVIGAGFIGLEFAAVANALGADVSVLELSDRPMGRAVSRETATFFANAHEKWGVQIHFGRGIEKIEGIAGQVTGVVATDGARLAADLVVVGIGIEPDVGLASNAGLDVANGILVDGSLSTSDSCISAVGDSVAFPYSATGQRLRIESVQNAVDQARCVAARLVGKPFPYGAVPWFWSDQGDLKLQIAGLLNGYDNALVVGSLEQRSFSVLCFREGRLIAVESVNRPVDHMAARKILAGERRPTYDEASSSNFELNGWAVG
jgi:NADPH-dependent 2,4-dienoyl-CoA reductase/sulfur reductase-like enzyme